MSRSTFVLRKYPGLFPLGRDGFFSLLKFLSLLLKLNIHVIHQSKSQSVFGKKGYWGWGGGGGTIVRRDWGRIWKKEGGNTYMIVNNYVRVCFILNRCKYSLTEQKR